MSNGTAKARNEHRSGQQNSILRGDVTLTNEKQEEVLRCQYVYSDLTSVTTPDNRRALPLRRRWWHLKGILWRLSILGPRGFISMKFLSSRVHKSSHGRKEVEGTESRAGILDLRPGEWVEVRPIKEIFATLDTQDKLKGLRFTPEMAKFCGKRFRVHKKLHKIILEATGELRGIKYPTVLLEGVFCDGTAHGKCDRSCFCFWREQWLKRTSPENSEKKICQTNTRS